MSIAIIYNIFRLIGFLANVTESINYSNTDLTIKYLKSQETIVNDGE